MVQLLLAFTASAWAQPNLDAASNIASLIASNVAAELLNGDDISGDSDIGKPAQTDLTKGLSRKMGANQIHMAILKVLREMKNSSGDPDSSSSTALESIIDPKAAFMKALSSLKVGHISDELLLNGNESPKTTVGPLSSDTGTKTPNNEAPATIDPSKSSASDSEGKLLQLSKVVKKPFPFVPLKMLSKALADTAA